MAKHNRRTRRLNHHGHLLHHLPYHHRVGVVPFRYGGMRRRVNFRNTNGPMVAWRGFQVGRCKISIFLLLGVIVAGLIFIMYGGVLSSIDAARVAGIVLLSLGAMTVVASCAFGCTMCIRRRYLEERYYPALNVVLLGPPDYLDKEVPKQPPGELENGMATQSYPADNAAHAVGPDAGQPQLSQPLNHDHPPKNQGSTSASSSAPSHTFVPPKSQDSTAVTAPAPHILRPSTSDSSDGGKMAAISPNFKGEQLPDASNTQSPHAISSSTEYAAHLPGSVVESASGPDALLVDADQDKD